MQLVIDQRHQSLQRLAVPVTPVFEKLRYVVRQDLSVSISSVLNNFENSCPSSHHNPIGPALRPNRKGPLYGQETRDKARPTGWRISPDPAGATRVGAQLSRYE